MPCLSRRVLREILLSQLFHRHRTLAWPKQLHQTRSLFFLLHLPPFWPPSPTQSSKCCRPSKQQASRFLARRRAWPFLEAFLLRHHTQASLPLKRRRLLHLARVSQLLHRPWRPPWPQVGQIMLLSQLLCQRFPPQIPSLAFPSSSTTVRAAFPSSAAGASPLAQLPVLHQPFVVGPGFSPVPAKLVSQIMAGKFVELHELLPANIIMTEPEPQLLFDGRLVLTSSPKKPKRRIEDISTWLEAFSIYCLVLVSHFPNRWKDLLQYQLLILRTHHQLLDFLGQPLMLFLLSLFLVQLPPVSAVTPLQADQFAWELHFHPDRRKVNFVVDGIRHGFPLGFSPSQKLKSAKYNKPSAAQHPSVVDQYLANEASLGRVAGPFTVPPYRNLHISSFGVIPKRGQPG